MVTWTLAPLHDWAALEAAWRALEPRARPSFFQTWTWMGCLGPERFSDPVVLTGHEAGRVVALALFNRRRHGPFGATLHLGETGDPAWDALFVEHNGPLIESGGAGLLAPCLAAAMGLSPTRAGGRAALVLSGVAEPVLAAASSLPAHRHLRLSRPSPFVALRDWPAGGYLAALGGSTRYQLRRSQRRYAALGPLAIRRAANTEQALSFLGALVALHQASWIARGQPGAFATAQILRFHRALVARGHDRGEVDLLRITAGAADVGYLYNFRDGQRVCNYQGGFAYAVAEAHQKPGLTCHHLAIEAYAAEGLGIYDFLAGEDRYKTSLATGAVTLHWLEIAPSRSTRGLLLAGARWARGLRDRAAATRRARG